MVVSPTVTPLWLSFPTPTPLCLYRGVIIRVRGRSGTRHMLCQGVAVWTRISIFDVTVSFLFIFWTCGWSFTGKEIWLTRVKTQMIWGSAHVEVCHLNRTQADKQPIRFIPPEPGTSWQTAYSFYPVHLSMGYKEIQRIARLIHSAWGGFRRGAPIA